MSEVLCCFCWFQHHSVRGGAADTKADHGVIHYLVLDQEVLEMGRVFLADVFVVILLAHPGLALCADGHGVEALGRRHGADLVEETMWESSTMVKASMQG